MTTTAYAFCEQVSVSVGLVTKLYRQNKNCKCEKCSPSVNIQKRRRLRHLSTVSGFSQSLM